MQTNSNCVMRKGILELAQSWATAKAQKHLLESGSEFEKLQRIIAEQLGVDVEEVKPESKFGDDLGADSLEAVELIMAIEEEFDIEIPDEVAEGISTVFSAYDFIINKLSYQEYPAKEIKTIATITERMSILFENFKVVQIEMTNKLIRSILDPQEINKLERFSSLLTDLNIQQADEAKQLISQAMDTNHGIKMMKIANLLEKLSTSELDEAVESIRAALDSSDGTRVVKLSNLVEELGIVTVDEAVSLASAVLDKTEQSNRIAVANLLQESGIDDLDTATKLANFALMRIKERSQLEQSVAQKKKEVAKIQLEIENYQAVAKDKKMELEKLEYELSNLVL